MKPPTTPHDSPFFRQKHLVDISLWAQKGHCTRHGRCCRSPFNELRQRNRNNRCWQKSCICRCSGGIGAFVHVPVHTSPRIIHQASNSCSLRRVWASMNTAAWPPSRTARPIAYKRRAAQPTLLHEVVLSVPTVLILRVCAHFRDIDCARSFHQKNPDVRDARVCGQTEAASWI
jgi:hypothetical protein